jgi:HK97 family phage major capsid protein
MSDRTPPAALVEQRAEFKTKQAQLHRVFELAQDGEKHDFSRKNVQELLGAKETFEAVEKVRVLNDELGTLGEKLEAAEMKHIRDLNLSRTEALTRPISPGRHPDPWTDQNERKTLGQMFVETKSYKAARDGIYNQPTVLEFGMKTLFQTTAGFPPENPRSGLLVEKADLGLAEILELIPTFTMGPGTSFVYMEETTRTHAAAERAEGATTLESTFVYAEASSPVRSIGDSIPVTEEQLQDEATVASLLDSRLRYGVRKRLATQVIAGNGTPPNLRGILNVAGIQVQPKGADSTMAAAYKAVSLIRFTGDAEPSAFVFHPNDWLDIVLAQETTGPFIWGHPSMAPMNRLWGLPVAVSTGITEGTGLVVDFRNFTRLDERRGVEVEVGYVSEQFKEFKRTLRAGLRTAFTLTRPAAACTITGI